MIQHTERWGRGGGTMICHSPYISLSPSTTRQTTLRKKVGEAGSLQQNLPPEAQKTPHGTVKWLTVCLPSTVWHVKKQKQKQKRGEKAHEKHKETNNPTHRNPTFKTGRATRHLHVLAPTKISRYIEEYTGPDRNEPKREKTRGRKLLCTWNSSISGVAEGSQNINNTQHTVT